MDGWLVGWMVGWLDVSIEENKIYKIQNTPLSRAWEKMSGSGSEQRYKRIGHESSAFLVTKIQTDSLSTVL
jgi:hypothetical protein